MSLFRRETHKPLAEIYKLSFDDVYKGLNNKTLSKRDFIMWFDKQQALAVAEGKKEGATTYEYY